MHEQEVKQHNTTCVKCKENFVYMQDEVKWIEHSTYSEKIVTCPICGCINSVEYIDDYSLFVNDDRRYYR